MRVELTVALAFAASGCDVDRDLNAGRFACGYGGPCGDGGAIDDGGTREDASTIEVPPCDPSFEGTARGGDPRGHWRYETACADRYVFEDFTMCAGAVRKGQFFTLTGTLTVDAMKVDARSCSFRSEEFVFVPDQCANLVGGCSAFSAILIAVGGNCVAANGGCDCQTTRGGGCMEYGLYTIDRATLKVGGMTDYAFTAADSTLIYEPRMADGFEQKIIFVLTKIGE